MVLEPRCDAVRSEQTQPTGSGRSCRSQAKPFEISKQEVFEAYKRVKSNKGGEGCDAQSLEDFAADLKNNLYKIWNRLSSGSYMPPPVLRVEISKSDGGIRKLGIPTVGDRIAQMVVKQRMEPEMERIFHPDSYGYQRGKSALDAVAVTRERCWHRPWVLDMDIKGFFDAIDHDLLMLAVEKHVPEKWMRLYIERWLKAPVQHRDGRLETRDVGTPQGGVISPVLANLFLHYVFDIWVEKHWHGIQFERYAGDIVCHCVSEREALRLKEVLNERFEACGLTLHPGKTKIVYCKSSNNKQDYPRISFDFLGHTFKPRLIKSRKGVFFVGFTPAISGRAAIAIREKIRNWKIFRSSRTDLRAVANDKRSTLAGWINFYGKYGRTELNRTLYYLDEVLIRWARRKYKRLKRRRKAALWFKGVRIREPNLFVHWKFANETMAGR